MLAPVEGYDEEVHNFHPNILPHKYFPPLSLPLQVLHTYHPLALRWWLVSTHYRQPINYTLRSLEEASDRLYYIFQSLVDVENALVEAGQLRFHGLAPALPKRGSRHMHLHNCTEAFQCTCRVAEYFVSSEQG